MKATLRALSFTFLTSAFLTTPASAAKEFVVVALDGGGTRGAATHIEVIRSWQEVTGHNFHCDVNMLFGTSIGGILSYALASGYDIQDCYDLLITRSPEILREGRLSKLLHLGGVIYSKYSTKPLEDELQGLFGDKTLADITGMYVGATTWNEVNYEPVYLSNWDCEADVPGLPGSHGSEIPVWIAARKTGAAPTYWDALDDCVDGGVFANNPAAIAYDLACGLMTRGIKEGVLDADGETSVVKLYSFGTGTYEEKSHHIKHLLDANLAHQAIQIAGIAMNTCAVEKQLAARFKSRSHLYYRFSPLLTQRVPLDCKDIPTLESVGEQTRTALASWDRWDDFAGSIDERHSYGVVPVVRRTRAVPIPDEES